MEATVIISMLALGVSAIGFFYKVGRDTKTKAPENEILTQIYRSTETINRKLDDISEWQRKASEIHATHEERIKTLFNDVERAEEHVRILENRMEDREVLNRAIQKILERLQ